ncbi:MAG: hypothetical protein QM775_28785 [Pirellulales bacterium]
MAHPISRPVRSRDPRAELHSRLEAAPEEHAEALLAAYEVLQGLHDRGALELLRGMLGSGDKVLEIAVNAARNPQSIRSLRNLLLLVNMVGEIDPEQLRGITQAVPQALNAAHTAQPLSLWRLLSVVWNKNIRRALGIGISLLDAIGGKAASRRNLGENNP